jgi:recombination protein U
MKNLGKRFEENWKKSIPSDTFFYRFRDSGSTYYGGNQNLRFSASNIADCMLYDTNSKELYLCELKSHKGKSLPMSCVASNKTKEKQIDDLYNASQFDGVNASLIVFFSDVERCFELPISELLSFSLYEDRKSIPISYFEEKGVEIEVIKLQTNHKFNVAKWLREK